MALVVGSVLGVGAAYVLRGPAKARGSRRPHRERPWTGHLDPGNAGSPMNADDSARLRDLLANNRTLLAYIRTAVSFAGLGFAVAKFGLNPKIMHLAGYLGTFMVLAGLLVIITGFAQHRAVLLKVGPLSPGLSGPSRLPHAAAAVSCALVCALLAVYLAATAT